MSFFPHLVVLLAKSDARSFTPSFLPGNTATAGESLDRIGAETAQIRSELAELDERVAKLERRAKVCTEKGRGGVGASERSCRAGWSGGWFWADK